MDSFKDKSRELDYKRYDAPDAWSNNSPCKDKTDLFFGDEEGATKQDAIDICNTCSARIDCLEYAIFNQLNYGIAGGKTSRERIKLRKKYIVQGRVALIAADRLTLSGVPEPDQQFEEISAKQNITDIPRPFNPFALPEASKKTS
jgi:WhiB family redox-sensing transcriptional regulator